MPTSSEPTPVAAVERALQLLGAFHASDSVVSLSELADRTGLNKSTIMRLAASLERFGYLRRGERGDYRMGPTPLALATIYQRSTQPAERVLPALERLAAATGESAAFFVPLDDAKRICLYRVDSKHAVREHLRPGDVSPIDRGAAGRVLSAPGSASIIVTAGEVTPDVRTAAAPVFDHRGDITGAIAVSGPQYRFTMDAVAGARPALLDAARDVTLRMGGDPSVFTRRQEGP